ncbi:MAG: phosphatase PAP2 family protein [Pseudomonadaceae bacterium]|nr:phosphatase PAP2 family protein [Pseudomonadaceae bacterium]
MKHRIAVAPLLLAAAGLAAGALLWASGGDVALNHWLLAHESPTVTSLATQLGWLGLGRVQIIACLLAGLWCGAHARGRRVGCLPTLSITGRWLLGLAHQTVLLLRGQRQWTPHWRTLPYHGRVWLLAIASFALAGLAQLLLKISIGRPRPKETFWNGIDPYTPHPFGLDAGFWSFPSGHSTSSFAIAMVLMAGFPRWRWPILLIATLLAASRFMALTPHYVGDVIAGSALGAAVALYIVRTLRVQGNA